VKFENYYKTAVKFGYTVEKAEQTFDLKVEEIEDTLHLDLSSPDLNTALGHYSESVSKDLFVGNKVSSYLTVKQMMVILFENLLEMVIGDDWQTHLG
jgi:hypothetical protein